MSKSLNELFYDIILLNELDGNVSAALRFSDPDGVLSGKSGWSFGVCQFDTQNNSQALVCLKACGFTQAEITGIVEQTIDVKPLASKLKANRNIVEEYSTIQLSYCLTKALNFDTDFGIPVENPSGILAGADYVNQYGSQGNGAKAYYKNLGRPVTAEDVLAFRFTTAYGQKHPKDCQRRYDNIIKILRENNL
jgi:hypothetical protein